MKKLNNWNWLRGSGTLRWTGMESAKSNRWLRYVAMVVCVLMLGVGQMWAGTDTFTMSSIFTGSNTSATVTTPANATVSTTTSASNADDGKLGSDGNYFQIILSDKTFSAASINGYINTTSTDKNWGFQFTTNGGSTWASEVTQANDGTKSAHDIDVDVTIPSGANGIRVIRKAGTTTYVFSITLTTSGGSGSSTYTVTYDGNGKTGGSVPTDSNSPYAKDATVTVLGNTGSLVRAGYTFAGWNTEADGSGADYSADDTFTMGTSNVTLYAQWTLNLATHSPGKYTTAAGSGGYGKTLKTVSSRDYEVYMFNSAKLRAGSATTVSDGLEMLEASNGTDVLDGKEGWILVKASGGASGSGAIQTDEFIVSSETESDQKAHYIPIQSNGYLKIKVSGYDQFSFVGRDNSTSDGKKFVVNIDGASQSFSHTSTDNTIYRFDITTGTHVIEVTGDGTNANRLRGFSLRIPECTAPGVATSLSNSSSTSSSVTIGWTKGANITSQYVYLYTDADCTSPASPTEDNPQQLNSSATSCTFTGLSASTTYYAKVRSLGDGETYCDNDVAALYSAKVAATTSAKAYTVTAATSTGEDTYGTVEAEDSSLDEGETTTITASPATGYQVTNWAVSGTDASISPSGSSNSNTTTLTMGTANATVTVTFGLIDYTVSKTLTNCAVKAGSTAIPSTMNYGDDLSTTIAPNSGYVLPSTITVTGVTSYTWNAFTGALTLTDVTGNVSISIAGEAQQIGTSKTVTYTMITTKGTTASYSSSTFTNVLSGGASSANTLVASNTMKGGNGVGVQSEKTTANGTYTAGITSSTDDFAAGTTPYVEFKFDVVDGCVFTPTGISVPVQPISNNAYFKILVTDESSTWTTTSSECTQGSLTTITIAPTGGSALSGTVYVRVYCYSQDESATGYRLGTPITVTGTVLVDVVAPMDLAKSSGTYNSLTFGWTKATNASTYTATLYSDSGCETEVESKDLSDVNTVTFTGLSASTTYYCKVQSHGDGTTYVADGGTTSAASGATTAEPKVVYLKNTMGWANAYLNFYSASYWDESKGSGNATGSAFISGPHAMSYDSEKGLFYYEAEDADDKAATIVSFTKDNQSGYDNFYNTEAIYSFDKFAFNKAFVPVTQSDTYTKNNGTTKYYTYSVVDVDDAWTGYYLWASGQSWEPKNNEFTDNGDGTLSFTKSLSVSTKYEFKINEKNNAWGSATFIVQPIAGRTFASDAAACALYTGPAGDYTFTINTTTKAVSVSYPSVSHPVEGYAYFPTNGDWSGSYYIHWWGASALTTWGSDPQITTDAVTICSTDYVYFPLLSDYTSLIIKDNAGDTNNKTGDLSSSGSSGKYYNSGWNSFGPTVSYDANKGSGTMDDSQATCGDVTLSKCTFTRTGWTFAGWNTNKYGSGTPYADEAELTGISSDLTLYAQWERTIYLYSTASAWYADDADFQLHYWDGDATSNNGTLDMELADNCSDPKVYKATISGGGYDKLLFYRLNPEDHTEVWTQTVDLDFDASKDMYKLTNMSGGAYGNAYGEFVTSYSAPTLTISFEADGGTGSMDDISSIACEGSVTVPDNGFTAPYGKEFANWTADVDVTADEEDVAAGEDIAVDAVLTKITSDITLTAKWNSLTTYTITHSAATNGSYTIKEATLDAVDTDKDAIEGAIITLAATPSSGYVFDHWTVTETSGGAAVSVSNANVSPATFTMPAKAVTVAAAFKKMPNVYYYKDEDHYVDGAYKNPEGGAVSGKDNQALTTPWTICDGCITGVTSVVATGAVYDNKGSHMNAYVKTRTNEPGKIVFTIASGFKATIRIKMGGYNGANTNITMKLNDTGDNIAYTGTMAGAGTTENAYTQLTYSDLAAGAYTLKPTSGSLYISEIDVQTEYVPVTEDADSWAAAFDTPPTTADDITLGGGGEGDPITITIANGETAKAKSITLNNAKLNIQAGGVLIVANSISKGGSATAAGDIHLGSDAEHGNAALIMGDYDGTNEAEVEFYTKAGKNAKGEWVNQFIGTPYNDEDYVKTNFYGAQIYEFRAAQDGTYPSGNDNYWTRLSDDGDMAPFMGYNLLSTQTAGTITLDMNGKLVRTDQKVEKTMYYNGSSNTENMFANSWVAPIHIPAFETTDFGGGEATIYIFNAGTPEDAEDYEMGDGSADNNSPGQYIVLPIASSTWLSSTTVTVIPAMQAFSVFATDANQTLSLDYNKLVYEPALDSVEASKGIGVIPTRAKKNEVAPEVVKLHVSAVSGYAANAFVLGREDFTDGFDNGWDGRYMEGNEEAPQLYSLSADGDMTVNCVPEIEGIVLGFKAGSLDQAYTMSFEYNGEEELYLKDLYKNKYIESGETYWFTTDEDDVSPHNRFILTRYRSPQVATDLEPTPDPSLNGRENGFKFVEDQKIYILYRGVLYDATGKRVEERRNQK